MQTNGQFRFLCNQNSKYASQLPTCGGVMERGGGVVNNKTKLKG